MSYRYAAEKNIFLDKVDANRQYLHDLLMKVSHTLNKLYLDPSSWVSEYKADQSLVTTADHMCHEQLCTGLTQLGFGIPIISEENTPAETEAFQQNPPDVYWLIDPLDGTSGFVNGTGHFAINVALIFDKQAIAGWIAWPRTGLMCWAFGDQVFASGSFVFEVIKPESLAAFQKLRLEQTGDIIFSSTSQARRKQQVIATLSPLLQDPKVYSLGAALKFCAMFIGLGDFYPRLAGTCLWDLAAGQVLLKAKGGDILRLDGRSMEYDFSQGPLNSYFLAVTNRRSKSLLQLLHHLQFLAKSF